MHGSPTVNGQLSEQGVTPERMHLLLPSSLSVSLHRSIGLLALVDKVFRLRQAQADDALVSLWQSLCVQWHLQRQKLDFVRGQWSNTRSNALIDANRQWMLVHANMYHCARSALLMLNPACDDCTKVLLPLGNGN